MAGGGEASPNQAASSPSVLIIAGSFCHRFYLGTTLHLSRIDFQCFQQCTRYHSNELPFQVHSSHFLDVAVIGQVLVLGLIPQLQG